MPDTLRACSNDPRAPHGFDRIASHNTGRYVCECEAWQHHENNLTMKAFADPKYSVNLGLGAHQQPTSEAGE